MKKLNYLIIAVLLFGVNVPDAFAQRSPFGPFGEFMLPVAGQFVILGYQLFIAMLSVIVATRILIYWVSNDGRKEKVKKTIVSIIGYVALILTPYLFFSSIDIGRFNF